MRNERDVKAEIKKIIRRHRGYFTMPVTGGYGPSGVPDILACVRGRFVAIEAKFGYSKPTALQKRQLHLIRESGGISLVINENNLDLLESALMDIPSDEPPADDTEEDE